MLPSKKNKIPSLNLGPIPSLEDIYLTSVSVTHKREHIADTPIQNKTQMIEQNQTQSNQPSKT
jgi:hypothetical protein